MKRGFLLRAKVKKAAAEEKGSDEQNLGLPSSEHPTSSNADFTPGKSLVNDNNHRHAHQYLAPVYRTCTGNSVSRKEVGLFT
jgi:hypothetical protein